MFSKFIRRFCSEAKNIGDKAAKTIEKDTKPTTKDVPGKPKEPEVKPVKRINVSLQGANNRAGHAAALLLKQHPLIKKIYMYDTKIQSGIASDLNCIDSSAKVEAFSGDGLSYSLRAADIAVLIDTDGRQTSMEKKFETSYFRVKKFAETCNLHCPKAVFIVCVDPICCMTSLVQSVLEDSPFYHPSRLLGNVSALQSMINSIVAINLNLDPTSVHVPLVGGPDIQTVVPLISLMTPDPGLSPRDQITFYDMVKKKTAKAISDMFTRKCTLNDGYAIGKILITVAKGLNGHPDALANVLTRTSQVYPSYPIKYLVSTVKFGLGGIYHNYGIPKLSPYELQQLEKSILKLEKRDNYMKETHKQIKKMFLKCQSSH